MRRSKFTAVLLLSVILFGIAQPAFAIDWDEVTQPFTDLSENADVYSYDPSLLAMGYGIALLVSGANVVKQLVVGSEAERAEQRRKEEEERKKQESSWWWPF